MFHFSKRRTKFDFKWSFINDNKKVKDYNINEGTQLELSLKENYLQIDTINIMGKIILIYLKTFDTIKKLKEKIEERECIPQKIRKLIINPKDNSQELEDNKTFEDYNIKNNSQIHILYKK